MRDGPIWSFGPEPWFDVLFDGKRAIGVEFDLDGATSSVTAAQEVILSAGAIHSPALLQVSGIGPAEHLSRLGVPLVHDAPDVGSNLREHRTLMMTYRVKSGSLNRQFHGGRLLANVLRYLVTRSGPMTHAAHELCAFVKSRPDLPRADCEIGFGLFSIGMVDGKVAVETEPGMSVIAYYGRPDSQGSVMIQSADPAAAPAIDANYLATPEDRRANIDMVRFIRRLMDQPALKPWLVKEVAPGPDFETDDEIIEAFFKSGSTAFHVSGTCRMGADASSVVDPELRVRGVEGLRVIDTSVMPSLVTGNTNGPAMAMALRASELILGDRVTRWADA